MCKLTVFEMEDEFELEGPATLVLVQVLVIEGGVSVDGQTFSKIVAISGGLRGMSVRCVPLYCSPVLYRPLDEVVEALLSTLVETGRVAADAAIVASPAVRITEESAAEIVDAFRKTAEDLLREREIAMLEELWELS